MPSLVRVLPGEVHINPLEPGRAPFVLTRSEAIVLANDLSRALRLAEPLIPRLPWYRRVADWLRRRRQPKPTPAQLERVKQLMGSAPTQRWGAP